MDLGVMVNNLQLFGINFSVIPRTISFWGFYPSDGDIVGVF